MVGILGEAIMKAANYRQDEEHYSEDGKTVCWKIYPGEYQLQTTNPEVVKVISRWTGIEEVGRGENFYMRLYKVPSRKIDRVIEVAKLPPRRKIRRRVREAEKVGLGV